MADISLIDKLILPLGLTGILWLIYMIATISLAISKHRRDKRVETMVRDMWIDYIRNKK